MAGFKNSLMAKTGISKRWSLKQDILTMFYAFKDERTPWYARLTSLISILYLVSPIDLIPDVIPFAGFVDDLFVVPLLVSMATRLLPGDVKRIAQQKAEVKSKRLVWVLILCGVVLIGILVLIYLVMRNILS
jgi:uncharacterized membrane protein YkvA (DUF1232 family)